MKKINELYELCNKRMASEAMLFPDEVRSILMKIEKEISDNYMVLPRLDDGVINVGDFIESTYDGIKYVQEVEWLVWDGDRWDFKFVDEDEGTWTCASIDDFYACSKHVDNPNAAIEQVLREMLDECLFYGSDEQKKWAAAEYAKKIREAFEEEGEIE